MFVTDSAGTIEESSVIFCSLHCLCPVEESLKIQSLKVSCEVNLNIVIEKYLGLFTSLQFDWLVIILLPNI